MNPLRVSVLIPHFNNPSGLLKTVESLYSAHNFYLVIVDDGSDQHKKPIESDIKAVCPVNDVQTHILTLEKNLGVEFALNHGLEFIQEELDTEYILRIDCGDLCVDDRLEKQISYLDAHKNICLVGSWVEYIGENGNHLFNLKLPTEHGEIKKRMLVRVSFIHSAVMFRTSALQVVGLYTDRYKAAEDYAFFYEFVKKCKTANIPEVLTKVEWSSSGISVKRRRHQLNSRLQLVLENSEFSLTFIYGLFRLLMLMIVPYSLVEFVKKVVYK